MLFMTLSELDLPIEEAELRLVPHVIHATQTGAKILVIQSGDTDVMALTLYFKFFLKMLSVGSKEYTVECVNFLGQTS